MYACVVYRSLMGVALLPWELSRCALRMALASSLRFERAKKGPSMSKAQAMQLEKIRVSPGNVLVALFNSPVRQPSYSDRKESLNKGDCYNT